MKHPRVVLSMLAFVLWTNSVSAADGQAPKSNVIGLSGGMVFPVADSSIYIGSPVSRFFDRDLGLVVSGTYFRKLLPCLWVGGYVELENLSGEDGAEEGLHTSFGFHWLARYPDDFISIHAGGQLNLGMMTSEDWDTLFGIGFGLFIGPAMEFEDFGLAIYFQPVFDWFMGDQPEDITAKDPRVRLHFYYTF